MFGFGTAIEDHKETIAADRQTGNPLWDTKPAPIEELEEAVIQSLLIRKKNTESDIKTKRRMAVFVMSFHQVSLTSIQ